MRAPPVAEKQTSGARSASERSAARVNFSPTTEPIEPPMYSNSNAVATIGFDFNVPLIAISASFSPVAFCAAAMRSRYFFESRNFKGSIGSSEAKSSSPLPSSMNAPRRARARIEWWCEHFGHTMRLRSSSGRYSTAPQPSHFSHRPSGTLPFVVIAAFSRGDISFCNQFMS